MVLVCILLYMTDGQDQLLVSIIRLDRYMLYLSLGPSPLLLVCSRGLISVLSIVCLISTVCTAKGV